MSLYEPIVHAVFIRSRAKVSQYNNSLRAFNQYKAASLEKIVVSLFLFLILGS